MFSLPVELRERFPFCDQFERDVPRAFSVSLVRAMDFSFETAPESRDEIETAVCAYL